MKIVKSYLEMLDFNPTWLWQETYKFELAVVCLSFNERFFAIQMGIWGYVLVQDELDNSLLYEPYYMFNIYFLRSML